ncbi:hypothetical protein V0M98_38620 (plasmid) [Pseudomonas silesiensis]|uniref:hypothetical protein n=1 Tax=Pseudomonas silesiensis TaxID=1853130 RepID=UPI0030D2E929
MLDKKVDVIRQFVAYAESAIKAANAFGYPEPSTGFLKALKSFNDDPTQTDSQPFYFMNRVADDIGLVSEDILNQILLQAHAQGESKGLRKDRQGNEGFILYFSHDVRGFATDMCEKHGLGFANIGSEGLSLKDFSFHGLHSASLAELQVSLEEAKVLLQSIQH